MTHPALATSYASMRFTPRQAVQVVMAVHTGHPYVHTTVVLP
ncbi:hypothetical protein ACPEIC_29090 [Stenotrophomonas sp. NPDC087984]